jgi:hypothetical protein
MSELVVGKMPQFTIGILNFFVFNQTINTGTQYVISTDSSYGNKIGLVDFNSRYFDVIAE